MKRRIPCEDGGRWKVDLCCYRSNCAWPPEAGQRKIGFFPEAFRVSMALPTP